MVGSSYSDLMPLFEADEETKAVVIYSDSAATLAGWLKFSRNPNAYLFKEQFGMFQGIMERVERGDTHFTSVKVKAHVELLDGDEPVDLGNTIVP